MCADCPGRRESIAAGLACGVAISFTPFIGFHFLLAALLSWIIGGNLLASAIGTAAGNPWTFPFIWAWIYTAGHWILGTGGAEEGIAHLTLHYISHHVWDIFLPMLVGGVPTAIIVWFLTYYPVRRMIHAYHERRRNQRLAGRKRMAAKAMTVLEGKGEPSSSTGAE